MDMNHQFSGSCQFAEQLNRCSVLQNQYLLQQVPTQRSHPGGGAVKLDHCLWVATYQRKCSFEVLNTFNY